MSLVFSALYALSACPATACPAPRTRAGQLATSNKPKNGKKDRGATRKSLARSLSMMGGEEQKHTVARDLQRTRTLLQIC